MTVGKSPALHRRLIGSHIRHGEMRSAATINENASTGKSIKESGEVAVLDLIFGLVTAIVKFVIGLVGIVLGAIGCVLGCLIGLIILLALPIIILLAILF